MISGVITLFIILGASSLPLFIHLILWKAGIVKLFKDDVLS